MVTSSVLYAIILNCITEIYFKGAIPMSNSNSNLDFLIAELEGKLSDLGFEKNAEETAEGLIGKYEGDKGAVSIRYENGRFSLSCGDSIETADSKKLCAFLIDESSSEGDVKYFANDAKQSLQDKFDKKAPAAKKNVAKANQTVSKAAVKNGSFYDANTLASKLCLVFPELRPYYKENLSKYGEFMGEEFFLDYGAEKVINAIKGNNPQTMKKMFQILNEIYEDGTNDTQSLIAVTILGQLDNDKILLARCVDYMSETMAPPVIEVNRYLATVAGKKAKKKLSNPPAFKPKKEKKPGLFAQAMAQSGGVPPTV